MFEFQLNQEVGILDTELEGLVIGRAEYSTGVPNGYLVRYTDVQGNPCKVWFDEQDLEELED